MPAGRFTAMGIMHRLPVKLRTVFPRLFATSRERTVVALTIVEMMVDMSIEMLWPMEPWSSTYENAAREPFRPVITIGRTVIRRNFIVAIRANGRCAYADRNLCVRTSAGSRYHANSNSQKAEHLQHLAILLT
jgi:hypothetical protein